VSYWRSPEGGTENFTPCDARALPVSDAPLAAAATPVDEAGDAADVVSDEGESGVL
jgi:hypothetical protein